MMMISLQVAQPAQPRPKQTNEWEQAVIVRISPSSQALGQTQLQLHD